MPDLQKVQFFVFFVIFGCKGGVDGGVDLDAFSRAPHGENIFVFLMRLMDINVSLP